MHEKMAMEMIRGVLYYAEIIKEGNTIVVRIDDADGLNFDEYIRLDSMIGFLENEMGLELISEDETDMKSNFSMVSSNFRVYFSFSCNDKNEE